MLHITKTPPSNSGVARHSVPFDRALDVFARRSTIGLAVDAAETQRFRVVARLARDVAVHLARQRVDLVIVDLSGRALAELLAACLVAALPRRRRPILWLIAHDAPELVGPPLLFAFLDRKGGRRIGMALSGSIGRRLERWLVRRAAILLAFSVLGADAVRTRYGHPQTCAVPLPSEVLAGSVPRERVLYCPAGLSADDLEPVLAALDASDIGSDLTLVVGSVSTADRERISARWRDDEIVGSLEFTGFLDQVGLDRSFARATIAVRHHRDDRRSANWAAASGPVVSALAAGCALVSSDRRGSARCVEIAGSSVPASTDALAAELIRVARDTTVQADLSARALAHVRAHHEPEAVARYLMALWERSRRRDGSGGS